MSAGRYFRKKQSLIFVGIILISGFLSYRTVYRNQFLWDDEFNITENRYVTSIKYFPEILTHNSGAGAGRRDNFYRPMRLLAHNLVYSISGLKPFGFHLLNVALHLANATLLYFLIRRIFKKDLQAFIAALLWVFHPVQTEAITYISGTSDPLSVF